MSCPRVAGATERGRGAGRRSRCRSPRPAAAQAAPSAPAQLAAAAKKSPNRTVIAIVQFKAERVRAQGAHVVRAHHGKVTDRLPAISGFAVKLPAKQARALQRAQGASLNVTLNTPREDDRASDPSLLATNFPKTVGADKAGPPASPARASASPSSTPASTATTPTSRTPTARRASPT